MSGSGEGISDKSKSVHERVGQPVSRVSTVAAEGFGKNSSNYDAHRPGYTEEAVDIIAQAVASVASAGEAIQYQVVELGAGTGKLTEQLVKKLPPATKYLALEPSRNFLDTLDGKSLGVETVVGSADNIPVPDKSVQAVVCAQSFHWFSDVESIKSIHRVLAPAELLILVWNKKNFDDGWRTKVLEQRLEVMRKVGANTRELFVTGEWKTDIDQSPLFSLSKHLDLPGIVSRAPLEKVLSSVTTVSAYNVLSPEEREVYIERLRSEIKSWPGVDLDDLEMPYSTDVYIYVAQDQQ